MNAVAESFSWPFRGEWRSRWAAGVLIVLFLPVLFVPLLGYAIAATRSAEHEPSLAPPPWRLSARLLSDGLWTAILIALLASPFVMAFDPLAGLLYGVPLWHSGNVRVAQLYAHVGALFILVLCWGLVMLLLMPHAAARFAFTVVLAAALMAAGFVAVFTVQAQAYFLQTSSITSNCAGMYS